MFLNYQAFLDKPKFDGIYLFTTDSCSICEMQKDYLKNISFAYDIIEVITNEEKNNFEKLFGFCSFPFAIIYDNNTVVYSKKGLLCDSQINEINHVMKNILHKPQIKNTLLYNFDIVSRVIMICPESIKSQCVKDCIEHGEVPFSMEFYEFIPHIENKKFVDELITPLFEKIVFYIGTSDSAEYMDCVITLQQLYHHNIKLETRSL